MADHSTALATAIAERDLLLVTGKGGTGKSTLVAALGELCARARGRALVVELAEPARLPSLKLSPTVQTTVIDADRALTPAIGRLLKLPAAAAAVLNNRVLWLFMRTSPAVREMVVLDELRHQVERCTAERTPVVVDLPATGHAIAFLDTPRAVHRMLRVGPLAQVAVRAEQLLRDARRTELVLVALPEELPVNETLELWGRAQEIGVACRVVVVNQVPSSAVHHDDAELLGLMQQHNEGAVELLAQAAQGELDDVAMAQAQIARLRAGIPGQLALVPRAQSATPQGCVEALSRALMP